MSDQRSIPENFSVLAGNIKSYVKLKLEYLKISLLEKQAELVAGLMLLMLMTTISFFILLLLSLAFVYWFDSRTGNMTLAFLLVAAVWLLLGLVVYLFRKPLLINPVIRKVFAALEVDEDEKIVADVFEEDEDDEE